MEDARGNTRGARQGTGDGGQKPETEGRRREAQMSGARLWTEEAGGAQRSREGGWAPESGSGATGHMHAGAGRHVAPNRKGLDVRRRGGWGEVAARAGSAGATRTGRWPTANAGPMRRRAMLAIGRVGAQDALVSSALGLSAWRGRKGLWSGGAAPRSKTSGLAGLPLSGRAWG